MSKFEELQMTSLNKNEMSRDEYLYRKYKTKYLNLKRELEGGTPLKMPSLPSAAAKGVLAIGSAASKGILATGSAAAAAAAAAKFRVKQSMGSTLNEEEKIKVEKNELAAKNKKAAKDEADLKTKIGNLEIDINTKNKTAEEALQKFEGFKKSFDDIKNGGLNKDNIDSVITKSKALVKELEAFKLGELAREASFKKCKEAKEKLDKEVPGNKIKCIPKI